MNNPKTIWRWIKQSRTTIGWGMKRYIGLRCWQDTQTTIKLVVSPVSYSLALSVLLLCSALHLHCCCSFATLICRSNEYFNNCCHFHWSAQTDADGLYPLTHNGNALSFILAVYLLSFVKDKRNESSSDQHLPNHRPHNRCLHRLFNFVTKFRWSMLSTPSFSWSIQS